MNILMVSDIRSDQLGDTAKKEPASGSRICCALFMSSRCCADITLASPKGGSAALDPSSDAARRQDAMTRKRFKSDEAAAGENTGQYAVPFEPFPLTVI